MGKLVTLRKIPLTVSIAEVLKLQQFLATIDHYTENGFEWPTRLINAQNLEALREQLAILETKERPLPEELAHGYVPQEILWIHNRDGEIVGLVKVRTMLTPKLLREGGHIGYGIAPQHRGKGYAIAALQEAVQYCQKQHELYDLLLTAHVDNLASRHIIETVGGKKWDTLPDGKGSGMVRYWIRTD